MIYGSEHTNKLTWNEFGEITDKITKDILDYQQKYAVKIDAVVPILRSGAVLGTVIAIKLKILNILPIQLKSNYQTREIDLLLDLPRSTEEPKNILVCENNTYTASTGIKAIELVHQKYPKANLYYATIAKVYGGNESIPHIKHYFYGIVTNEMFKLTDEEANQQGIRKGITIFPWENVEDELEDINQAEQQHQ